MRTAPSSRCPRPSLHRVAGRTVSTLVAVIVSAVTVRTATPLAATVDRTCPTVLDVASISSGQTGTGLSVASGTQPRPFDRDAIERLTAAGIVRGRTATSYDSAVPVARDQVATLLVEALRWASGDELLASGGPTSPTSRARMRRTSTRVRNSVSSADARRHIRTDQHDPPRPDGDAAASLPTPGDGGRLT